MLKIIHDNYNYTNYNDVYVKLLKTIYIRKLLRKLIIYIQFYSTCQLN